MTDATTTEPYGALAPDRFNGAVLALAAGLPRNWLGMRLVIGLRRLVLRRLPDDAGLDVERFGLRLRLHPKHNGCEKGLLFAPQFFEFGERQALAARIAEAAGRRFVFVDVGANVGLFSLFVAACAGAGASARILAIEPERVNIKRLQFNLATNPSLPIEVLPIALGEASGQVTVVDCIDRGGTRVRPSLEDDPATSLVPCKTLAQALTDENVTSVDALKIDVEGMEDVILLPFFRDAPPSLWPRFLIVEDTRDQWRADLFSELQKCGYRVVARSRLNVMLER